MCGISGIVSFDKKVEPVVIQKMISTLHHRGPDGEGVWLNNAQQIGLGHNRLSIIDLTDNGHQPMQYANGRYTITFNGEIYNYLELKNDLQKRGYCFRSTSDTEVLLALYDLKKEKALEDLDGMFAFAIWDEIEQKLFCARDRFGEKPFYYKYENNTFVFGSEIKSILKLTNNNTYNTKAINLFLSEQKHINEPETFFKNIFTLPIGSYIELTHNSQPEIVKYYNIVDKIHELKKSDIPFEEAAKIFRVKFTNSVKLRLRSDVPIGASLSGGLDSSSIVGVVSMMVSNFNTFSAVYPGKNYDESKWIDIVVKYNGIYSQKVEPTLEEYIAEMEKVTWHHEYPLLSSSTFLQWCVCKEVKRNGMKVLLDGQGADEFLGGYKDFKYFAIWDLYRKGKIRSYMNEVRYFKKNFNPEENFGKLHLVDPLINLFGIRRKEQLCYGSTFKERMLYSLSNELQHLLRYSDRNSMAHSIEVRLPFLNHHLMEFTLSLPNEYLYQNGETKKIMRAALKEYLPKEIERRTDKIGFVGPKEEWVTSKKFTSIIEEAEKLLINRKLPPSKDSWINVSLHNFFNVFDSYVTRAD